MVEQELILHNYKLSRKAIRAIRTPGVIYLRIVAREDRRGVRNALATGAR